MHGVSVIFVVDNSPNSITILDCIIIDGTPTHVIAGNFPHNFCILKEDLLDHVFGFGGIPSSVVESEITPFNPNGP
jgi:hypothetical protein